MGILPKSLRKYHMFSNDVTLVTHAPSAGTTGGSSKVYGITDLSKPNASIRSASSAPVDQPDRFRISTESVGSGDDSRLRTIVGVDRTVERAVDARQGTSRVYLVVDRPVKILVDNSIPLDQINQIVNFLATSGNPGKVLNGEI